jgi:Protein of unknown function (DUF2975)
MAISNKLIFDLLKVVSWIIFIGLCIEAGAIVFNLIYAFFKPEGFKILYKNVELGDMQTLDRIDNLFLTSFWVSIAVLKAYLFYLIIKLLSKLDLMNPFSEATSTLIIKISYFIFSIGLLVALAHQYAKGLMHIGINIENLAANWNDSAAFLMMAAIVYILAQIFKRGIELQSENDLTI